MATRAARMAPMPPGLRAGAVALSVPLAALACTCLFAALLAHSVELGVLVLVGMVAIPVAALRLPLAVCGWIVLVFFSNTSTAGEFPNRVLIFIGVCWIGLLLGHERRASKAIRDSYVMIALAALFIAWLVVSLAWAPAPGAVSTGVRRLLYGGFSFLLLIGAIVTRRDARWIARAFVVGATLSVLWGAAKGGLTAASGVAGEATDVGGRFQGGSGDPNYLAATLVPGIILAAALAARRAPLERLLLAVAIVIMAVGLAATQSRGGLIAACVCAAVALAIWRGRRLRIAAGIGLAAVATAGYFLVRPGAWTRIFESNQGSGRLDIWTIAWRVVHSHPFFGVGFGQFPQVSPHFVLRPGGLDYISLIVEKQIVVHNLYLALWVEGGIVALLAFAALAVGALASGWFAARSFDAQGDADMAALSRAAIVGLVGTLTAFFFLSNPENSELWIMLALGPVMAALARRRAGSGPPALPSSV
jgi:O-antigen ligase